MDAEKISDSHTELDNTYTGNATDEPMLKIDPVASEASEISELKSGELDTSGLQELEEGVQGIKEGDGSMFERIGDQFDLKTRSLKIDFEVPSNRTMHH